MVEEVDISPEGRNRSELVQRQGFFLMSVDISEILNSCGAVVL